MLYPLSTLLLLPFLLIQGRRVRRDTPRLPEPPGERHGQQGEGAPLRVLILGDSAAAGVGARHQDEALSGRLVTALAERHRVSWTLLAQTGRTSSDVLTALAEQPTESYDVALVSVGVNDVTGRTGTRDWQANLGALVADLRTRLNVRYILFTAVPPMGRFPALPQPLRWYLGLRADQLNGLLQSVCAAEAGCDYLAVPFPLDANLMASDGFHPGRDAYTLWGQYGAQRITDWHLSRQA
ncbi:SGNH/GDSL hydrolase family protein [Marinobacter zhejiangensis]|uniref:Lysophospholipase L1 n=1 Tax=Marinobacter zhejiangensis TaxID=488535 RepID=A0A1I4LJ61_9GAMM|nr:SGNH/GDSL hydrolase family protein [Marinobacter zhejiangensis]SFL91012.1 Lysophospholipase L1 [Marinobacter zhejiangensis]